jgi:hypothetical protein
MSFAINVITSAGAHLIAQATAANPIVLLEGRAGSTAAVDAADLASKPKSWYHFNSGNPVGSVFQASATGSTARIMLAFYNKAVNLTQPEIIKSMCVIAKLRSQDDSDAIILAASSDDDSEAYMPSKDSAPVSVHAPMNIAINTADQIETVGAEYAAEADLERFMSLHRAGNVSVGDNQTVLGNKKFEGYATFNGGVLFDSTVQCEGAMFITGNFTAADTWVYSISAAGTYIDINNTMRPSTNDTVDIGAIGKRFRYGHYKTLYTVDIKSETFTLYYGSDQYPIKIENGNFVYSSGINPNANFAFDLGTSTRYWRDVYCNSVYLGGDMQVIGEDGEITLKDCRDLIIAGSGGVKGDLDAKNVNAVNVGGSDLVQTNGKFRIKSRSSGWPDIELWNTWGMWISNASIAPNTTGKVLGAAAIPWEHVYAEKFNGLLETLYDPDLPVGSLAHVVIRNTTDSTSMLYSRGSSFADGDVVNGKTYSVQINEGQTGSLVSAPGRWALLNKTFISDNTDQILAVRKA